MVERKELHAAILDDLKARQDWEAKQADWDLMRHDGIPRLAKPFPGASDFHYPLADSIIARYKPFYYQQLFSMETLADFTPLKDELKPAASMVSFWFDDCLKRKSNLKKEILICADKMMLAGSSVLKILWDSEKKQIHFDAVDPLDIIIPETTQDLQDCDRLVHVIRLSVEAYKRKKNWNQNPDFIEKIRGSGDENDNEQLKDQKFRREGFTHFSDKNMVVIWEVFFRDDQGKWIVETYAPTCPEEDVRPAFKLPFNHGLLPFVDFHFEVKDKSFYSSRGIPETVAMFEAQLNKLMNEKNDALVFAGRPIYTSTNPIPNLENFQLQPGSVVFGDLRAVINPPPPVDYQTEVNTIRLIAEDLAGRPDYGINNVGADGKIDNRTATEASLVAGQSQIAIELKSSIFRDSLTKVYEQSYSLLIQYSKSELSYFFRGEIQNIEEKYLSDAYRITPSGNVNAFGRQQLLQKALARKQIFTGSPFIRQDELDRSCLELDDPRLVDKLFLPQDQAAASQAEDQAEELAILRLGFPAQVKATDDHAVHLETLFGYLQFLIQSGKREELDDIAKQRIAEHFGNHILALKNSKNPLDKKNAAQYEARARELFNAQLPQNQKN